MKELTTALLRVGTASAMFGARQLTNLLSANPKDRGAQAAETLNTVASTLMDQCGEPLRDSFDVAEKMQRELVDSALRTFAVGNEGDTDPMAGSLPGMMTQVVSRMGQMFSGFAQPAEWGDDAASEARTDRGPVPPGNDGSANSGVF